MVSGKSAVISKDSDERRQVPRDVGRALTEYRQRHDLTLQDISEITGVSIGTLSKIENEKATPSFRTLMRIMQVLDLQDRDPSAAVVSARKTVTRASDVVLNVTRFAKMDIHAAELLNKAMFPMVSTITCRTVPPREQWTRHEGDEFVFVLQGAIEVYVDEYQPFVLHKGESTYYDSGMRHMLVSVSRENAVVLSVSTSKPGGLVKDMRKA